jgi:transcriptional regulator with XRE-family HTH domain
VSTDTNRLGEYLRARRAQLKPEDFGYPHDPTRRVQGLRREEVAEIAGISSEYYTRLEQGRTYQASESVLAGLTRALKLDGAAAEYFYRLALPAPRSHPARRTAPIGEGLGRLLDHLSAIPVYVMDGNQDIVVVNDLARAFFPMLAVDGANSVLSIFRAPQEERRSGWWQAAARDAVAALRLHGDPSDARMQEIVGELSVRDDDFRAMWADYEVRPLTAGSVLSFVEGYGVIELPWQSLSAPDGLIIVMFLALPGTMAAHAVEHVRGANPRTTPSRWSMVESTFMAPPTKAASAMKAVSAVKAASAMKTASAMDAASPTTAA